MTTPDPLRPPGLRQVLAARGYRGPKSDHFDGKRFHNIGDVPHGGFFPFLRWRLGRLLGGAGAWARRTDSPPGPRPPEQVDGAELRVTFVGHSTVLLQTAGRNVLTDPIWSERASPFSWAGPRRHRPPGLRFEDLPPIDLVLLSHNHYDHLDLATLRRLRRDHAPRFVVPLGVGPYLAEFDVGPVTEMDWWQDEPLPDGMAVACVPAQHFSGRGLRDGDATLWCGYVLRGPAGVVYYAGDTGFGPHFEQIAARFGAPRLALLPIGGFLPAWFMGPVHISPEEAVRVHRVLGARTSVAIHFGTFALADDGEAAPIEGLRAALARLGGAGDFWALELGEGRDVDVP
ncbi:MAG TPA: MBL fold metallo-hydrolase [Gemmataceae bacterium]|nr:MBL fold metallo-hydrolase [Gemmataceae bacterium]